MESLPKKYDFGVDATRTWLDREQKTRVEDEVEKVHAKGGVVNGVCWLFLCIGMLLTVVMLLSSIDAGPPPDGLPNWSHHRTFRWLPFGTYTGIFSVVMLIVASGLSWIRSAAAEPIRTARRQKCEAAIGADPLVQRARILIAAHAEYAAHCARYRERRAQVDEGIAPAQPDADDAWHALIVRAHEALVRMQENFQNVVTRREREAALGVAPSEGALAALLALDGDSVPALATLLTDPERALEDERQLGATMRQLQEISAV